MVYIHLQYKLCRTAKEKILDIQKSLTHLRIGYLCECWKFLMNWCNYIHSSQAERKLSLELVCDQIKSSNKSSFFSTVFPPQLFLFLSLMDDVFFQQVNEALVFLGPLPVYWLSNAAIVLTWFQSWTDLKRENIYLLLCFSKLFIFAGRWDNVITSTF